MVDDFLWGHVEILDDDTRFHGRISFVTLLDERMLKIEVPLGPKPSSSVLAEPVRIHLYGGNIAWRIDPESEDIIRDYIRDRR